MHTLHHVNIGLPYRYVDIIINIEQLHVHICIHVYTNCTHCIGARYNICTFIVGLSPDLNDFDQIRSIARPTDVPDTGLLCDLLWSDPDKDMQGWGENDRGVSFTFGSDIVTKFLNRHDLDLICRAHQVS